MRDWAEFFAILCRHKPGTGAMIQDLIVADFNDFMLNALAKQFWMVPLSDGGCESASPLAREWLETTEAKR